MQTELCFDFFRDDLLAFWLFPTYLKKHIEAWLLADDGEGEPSDTPDK